MKSGKNSLNSSKEKDTFSGNLALLFLSMILLSFSLTQKVTSLNSRVESASIPSAKKADLKAKLSSLQSRVIKAKKKIAEENIQKAVKEVTEMAEVASSSGKSFCVSHVNVGSDTSAIREAVVKVMEQKGMAVMVFSKDDTVNKAFVCAGVPEQDGRFLEAAKRLNMDPSNCLVIEDSMPGVTAGKAAGMEVVAVPSLPKQSEFFTSADELINSLLDFRPEKGVKDTLPLEPWYIGGPVVKGFGRGSKVLGIPTANLSVEGYSALLSEHPSGVYFGWAGLAGKGVYKMVMSIGWNPYFNNSEKTIEPWLLHDFKDDFYGEDLRLVIVGYIRPEANFTSLESLIAKIHDDRDIAEKALELPLYLKYKDDPYLKSCVQQNIC